MPEFETAGASVHYEIKGSGPPLLLIAGTASDGASWGPLVPLLRGHQLILIDNRGSGRTRFEGPIEIAQMANDCAALLDHLGLRAVDVAGHSLGGAIGLQFAAAQPAKVARLVTMASGGLPASKRVLFHDMARLYFTMAPEDWFRLLFQWLFSDPFFADGANVAAAATASVSYRYRQSPGDFARQVAAIDRMAVTDLSLVTCPVLALSAEFDLLAPRRAVENAHKDVRNLRHVPIAGAAHSIHWEQPEAVAAAILDFLG